jgi:ABC-2 type transport system permease protein
MITLLRSELMLMWRSLLWWVVGIIAIVLFTVAFFPAVQSAPGFDEMMEQLPESLRPLIGTLDITSPLGYLLSQLYLFFLPALFLVYAIVRGSSTIAGEEDAGTLDLLLAQPVSRSKLYVVKACAIVIGIVVLALASWAPIQLVGPLFDLVVPAWNLIAVTLSLSLLTLFFAVIALAFSAGTGKRILGATIAAAIAFVTYLMDGFGQSIDWLEGIRQFTPWYWYDPTAAIGEGDILPGSIVLLVLTIIIGFIGLLGFRRRSLSA